MGFNWRPVFDPKVVRRELEIIKNDLHCNAVIITALDVGRVVTAATAALEEGLEVWLSPLLWDKSEDETVAYLAKAAGRLEALRKQWPDKVVLSVGGESTLFMQGILQGKNIIQRLRSPKFRASIMAGEHNAPLNAFLAKAVAAVRKEFKGELTYHSLIWEKVDWSLFDYVGVDHYRGQGHRGQVCRDAEAAIRHRQARGCHGVREQHLPERREARQGPAGRRGHRLQVAVLPLPPGRRKVRPSQGAGHPPARRGLAGAQASRDPGDPRRRGRGRSLRVAVRVPDQPLR